MCVCVRVCVLLTLCVLRQCLSVCVYADVAMLIFAILLYTVIFYLLHTFSRIYYGRVGNMWSNLVENEIVSTLNSYCMMQGRAEGGFQRFQETPFGFHQVLRKSFNKQTSVHDSIATSHHYKIIHYYYNLQLIGLHLTEVHLNLPFSFIRWALIRIAHMQLQFILYTLDDTQVDNFI